MGSYGDEPSSSGSSEKFLKTERSYDDQHSMRMKSRTATLGTNNRRGAGRAARLLSRYAVVSMFAIGLAIFNSASSLNADLDRAIAGQTESAVTVPLSSGVSAVEVLGEAQVAVDDTLSTTMIEMTNRERSRSRRKAYIRTAELDAAAAEYAATLTSGRLVHSTDLGAGVTGDWTKLGENLGRGRDLASIHQALMASPTHRANILDSGFTQIGIAVIRTEVGLVVVQRFRAG
jgi:uncharacterized protein YkwD